MAVGAPKGASAFSIRLVSDTWSANDGDDVSYELTWIPGDPVWGSAEAHRAAAQRARERFVPHPLPSASKPVGLTVEEFKRNVCAAARLRLVHLAAEEFVALADEDPYLLVRYDGRDYLEAPEIVAEIRGRRQAAELRRDAERAIEERVHEMYGIDVQLRLVAAGTGCVWRPVRTASRGRGRRARVTRRARAPSRRSADDPHHRDVVPALSARRAS